MASNLAPGKFVASRKFFKLCIPYAKALELACDASDVAVVKVAAEYSTATGKAVSGHEVFEWVRHLPLEAHTAMAAGRSLVEAATARALAVEQQVNALEAKLSAIRAVHDAVFGASSEPLSGTQQQQPQAPVTPRVNSWCQTTSNRSIVLEEEVASGVGAGASAQHRNAKKEVMAVAREEIVVCSQAPPLLAECSNEQGEKSRPRKRNRAAPDPPLPTLGDDDATLMHKLRGGELKRMNLAKAAGAKVRRCEGCCSPHGDFICCAGCKRWLHEICGGPYADTEGTDRQLCSTCRVARGMDGNEDAEGDWINSDDSTDDEEDSDDDVSVGSSFIAPSDEELLLEEGHLLSRGASSSAQSKSCEEDEEESLVLLGRPAATHVSERRKPTGARKGTISNSKKKDTSLPKQRKSRGPKI